MQICPLADFVVRHPSCEKGLTEENAEKKIKKSATFVDSAATENEHCTQFEVKV
jgi:hypothetical protein